MCSIVTFCTTRDPCCRYGSSLDHNYSYDDTRFLFFFIRDVWLCIRLQQEESRLNDIYLILGVTRCSVEQESTGMQKKIKINKDQKQQT